MVVFQLAEPEVLEGVVAVGVIFAIIAENILQRTGDRIIKTTESMTGVVGEGNGNNLKEKEDKLSDKVPH